MTNAFIDADVIGWNVTPNSGIDKEPTRDGVTLDMSFEAGATFRFRSPDQLLAFVGRLLEAGLRQWTTGPLGADRATMLANLEAEAKGRTLPLPFPSRSEATHAEPAFGWAKIWGHSPVQAWGETLDGRRFYARFRDGHFEAYLTKAPASDRHPLEVDCERIEYPLQEPSYASDAWLEVRRCIEALVREPGLVGTVKGGTAPR